MRKGAVSNMLVGVALGDTFGAGYEGCRKGMLIDQKGTLIDSTRYRQNPVIRGLAPGRYTDDTQMTIAVAEALLEGEQDQLPSEQSFADSFVKCYKREPIPGYSRRIMNALQSAKDGAEFLKIMAGRNNSTGNGCVMRTLPIGVLRSEVAERAGEVIIAAYTNARITHDSHEARSATAFVAHAAHCLLYTESKTDEICLTFGQGVMPDAKSLEDLIARASLPDGVPCSAIKTAAAALGIVGLHGNNPAKVLYEAVALGGDTDSVAAVALGLAAIREGLSSLPEFLERDFAQMKFGLDYLRNLGNELQTKYEK